MKRDVEVELYRCALMLGIVFLHTITFSPYVAERPTWLANILCSCVNGFVIISGWYGIRFRPSKILRLLSVGVYAILFQLIVRYCGIDITITTTPWFLYAYLFMMLLAPLVDTVLEKVDNKVLLSVFMPFFVLLTWSASVDMPIIGSYIPTTKGLGSYTGLTLLGCYVIGRLARRFELDQKFSTKKLLFSLAVFFFHRGGIW